MTYQIKVGDALEVLRTMESGSVQTTICSPPYLGLRDYGTATWQGGDPNCDHRKNPPAYSAKAMAKSTIGAHSNTGHAQEGYKATCGKCGATRIDAQIGLEPTPDDYVAKLVEVFREVKRVLRDDGTLWLNIADSFSNGVGSNLTNCLERGMKGQPLIFGDAATIGITAKSGDVALPDNGFPYGVLLSLLGIERITIKQRDNDFCQVLHTFASPSYCRITCPVHFVTRNVADLEIVLDAGYHASIVIANHKPDGQPIFGVEGVMGRGARKNGNGSFPIEEAGEPIAESIIDGQSFGNPIAFDAPLKRFPDVYLVNQAVALGDALGTPSGNIGNFCVTHATEQKVCLALGDCAVDLTAIDVSHLSFLNEFGSVVRYSELYHNASRRANSLRAKQEIGIPEMVKRALMEDGWICRSTIIWHKPNPMPESVRDRPTRSHEYLFLLTKSRKYYYDAHAIMEPTVTNDHYHRDRDKGKTNNTPGRTRMAGLATNDYAARNKRSVWKIATKPYKGAHFATFPPALVEPCLLAGSKAGDLVLDPFCGSGTVGEVAVKHNRDFVGIELNPVYADLAQERIAQSLI